MIVKYNGELLTKKELKIISNNFVLSRHAKERLFERFPNINIKECIRNSILAYWNTDGTINIALDMFNYIVLVQKELKFLIITFKEKSLNNIDIFTKRKLALSGYSRKLI